MISGRRCRARERVDRGAGEVRSSSECGSAAIGSTGSMLTMSRPAAGMTCQVSISAGAPSAARAAVTSRAPSPRSAPHQQPRRRRRRGRGMAPGRSGAGGSRRTPRPTSSRPAASAVQPAQNVEHVGARGRPGRTGRPRRRSSPGGGRTPATSRCRGCRRRPRAPRRGPGSRPRRRDERAVGRHDLCRRAPSPPRSRTGGPASRSRRPSCSRRRPRASWSRAGRPDRGPPRSGSRPPTGPRRRRARVRATGRSATARMQGGVDEYSAVDGGGDAVPGRHHPDTRGPRRGRAAPRPGRPGRTRP